jgi:hypothetical protein
MKALRNGTHFETDGLNGVNLLSHKVKWQQGCHIVTGVKETNSSKRILSNMYTSVRK